MASQAFKDKEKFFADLYALDDLAGEDDVVTVGHGAARGMVDVRRGPRSGSGSNTRRAGSSHSRLDGGVTHTNIAKKPRRSDRRSRDRIPPPPPPLPSLIGSKTAPERTSSLLTDNHRRASSLRRAQSEDTGRESNKKAGKKRLEIPQIFAGQTFFFVPNDNRAVPRKRRIEKAVLHGATWARAWTSSVTHVIVEDGREKADVVKATGQAGSLQSRTLVRDNWLTESLSYKEMRNSTARRFQLKEQPPDEILAPATEMQRDNMEEAVKPSSISEERAVGDLQRARDALDDLYEEAKATQYLPLDFDNDVILMGSFADADMSLGEADLEIKQGFQCMLKNDGKTGVKNPNAVTMGILHEMASVYDRMGDHWRMLSYRKAVAALRKQKTKIETKEQARAIPQIGERLAEKIEEIGSTNKLRRLDSAKSDPMGKVMQLFTGIYGVGPSVASKWIAQGHRTLEDIRSKVELTPNQRIGLEHYEDFGSRIPRDEAAEHARIVQDALRKFDPKLQLIVGGSYRRGSAILSDIDCLITKEGANIEHIRSMLMDSVIPFLNRIGFLKAALATTHTRDDGSKWHGASALPNSTVWRRIDLLFVPWDELGAALIYFTGNDIFNRSIRLLASKKGMRLNHHGLYTDVMRGKQRECITEGRLVEGQSEQKIFEILGVPWRLPEDRNC